MTLVTIPRHGKGVEVLILMNRRYGVSARLFWAERARPADDAPLILCVNSRGGSAF